MQIVITITFEFSIAFMYLNFLTATQKETTRDKFLV